MHYWVNVITSWSIWQPAVRLMRQLTFPLKMLLIAGFIAISLVWLLWVMVAGKWQVIESTRQEINGVRYASAIYPAMELAGVWRQQARNAAFGEGGDQLPQARRAFDGALERVQSLHTEVGVAMGVAETYAALEAAVNSARAVQPVAGSVADPEAVYQGMIGVSRGLANLLDAVTDRSGLALDPDLASYHLMSAVLLRAPELIQTTVEIRGLVRTALKAGQLTPPNAARLEGYLAILARDTHQSKVALDKVQSAAPTYGARLKRGAIQATQELINSVRQIVPVGATTLQGDSVAFVRLANQTIQGQFKQVEDNLVVLQSMLTDRQSAFQQDLWLALILTLICQLAAAYLGVGFFVAMQDGFTSTRHHLMTIAMGDLRSTIRAHGRDEVTSMLKETANMQRGLVQTVRQVQQASDAVVQASQEISQGMSDLAARTESAAAALEQSSAALEQTNSTVAMTADSVTEASRIASSNANTASQGGAVMQDVADTMDRIQASSKKISDIIGVIDGIAFQTNILALNAAVEAARAGEQGRGFAVVADEVRNLAARTSSSTKEISDMITAIQQGTAEAVNSMQAGVARVADGVELSRRASVSISQIKEGAHRVRDNVSDISLALREQSLASNEISRNVERITQMSEANSVAVQSTAQTARELERLATELQQEVNRFRV